MAAPCERPDYTVEVHFAQRLAANEKKTRDRAVKRLRQWIAARSRKGTGLEEGELMRLWKGLYYCMWMSDKPVIQEELADQISDMPHCFKQPHQAVKFYDTFILTMKREWIGIDHLRMDKFLMLVRRTFRQMLVLLHNNDWDDKLTELFLNAMRRSALNPDVEACPDGLRYQIANVFLDELAREGTEDLTPRNASQFLVPFAELAAKTLNKKLRSVILEDIFQDVVERSNVGEDDKQEEDEGIASDEERKKKSRNDSKKKRRKKDEEDEGEEEEEEEVEDDLDILEKVMFPEEMVPPLEYDYGFLADTLFKLASSTSIPSRNRKPLYTMVKRFQSLAKGVYPMPDLLEAIRNEKDNEYLKDELPWWKKLQEREKKKKRRRKRRRGKKGQGGSDDEDVEEEEEEEEEEVVVKKKKRKTKETTDDVAGELNVEVDGKSEKKKKKKREKDSKADGKMDGTSEGEDSGAPTEDSGLPPDGTDISCTKTKKVKGKKNKSSAERPEVSRGSGVVEDSMKDDAERLDQLPADADAPSSKKPKSGKKGKKAGKTPVADKAPSGDDEGLQDISKVLFQEDKEADISTAERDDGAGQSSAIKTKRKKKGKHSAASPKTSVLEISASPDEAKSEVNDTPRSKVRGEAASGEGSGEASEPFAAFQPVSPPVAYVKKSKAKSADPPCTLPRAKAKSRVASQFTPPMTRKRVKIALSKNEAQAVHEYKKSVKLSPGVPFDGAKKPTHSVLKQTPKKSDAAAQKVKGSAKRSTRKATKRAKATDFF